MELGCGAPMLQALELYGFKSFADKTRFEFPPGITVIVGPNGSGKSNVVDAIRWVLGEQSARSLRGKEMADVIFKGNGVGGRKMMGAAEATLIFDNRERRLNVDADEVRVTRRVYQSGEGEYLVNGQPCRLRDIRDLFRGTGLGTVTYSLIEQGKVDQVLQATPRERRLLFEEAAGISRFRFKKVEAQKRLERAAQNLLRLRDIVEEVEARLQTLRTQAGKARQYREYTERLQQLRTEVAWYDWRTLRARIEAAAGVTEAERQKCQAVAAEQELLETEWNQLEAARQERDQVVQQLRERMSWLRDQITSRVSLCELERARLCELEEETQLHRVQLVAARRRVQEAQLRRAELQRSLQQQQQAWQNAEDYRQVQQRVLAALQSQWETLEQQSHAARLQQTELMRRVARIGREQSRVAAELAAQQDALRLADQQWADAARQVQEAEQRLAQLLDEEARLAADYERHEVGLCQAQQACAQTRRLLSRRQQEVVQLRGRCQALHERIALLEDWQRRREGISPGVRQLLEMRDQGCSEIVGMVAELLRADVTWAPLIDAALGEKAQWVVVSQAAFLDQLVQNHTTWQGRVSLIALDRIPRRWENRPARWEGRPGVLGRADRFVECPPPFAPLVAYLLGTTYLVERLADALYCHQATPGRARFVTLQGEVVERDGTVIVGPRQRAEELVSRRMELESLQRDLATAENLLQQSDSDVRQMADHLELQEQQLRRLVELERLAHQALAEKRAAISAARQEVDTTRQRCELAERQRRQVAEPLPVLSEQEKTLAQQLSAAELQLRQIEQSLTQLLDQRDQVDAQRQQQLSHLTAAQVAAQAAEHRLQDLASQLAQAEHTVRERTEALTETLANFDRCIDRCRSAERVILQATAELATLYWEKDRLQQSLDRELAEQAAAEARRTELTKRLQLVQRRHQQAQEQFHRRQLELEQLRQACQALESRIREDFGVDVATWQATALEELTLEERTEREREIETLRRRINQLGAVNLQALEELDSLESRYAHLAGQYQDLLSAKESLERLIQRINADSRRLFLETLNAIRSNFQVIFRKSFGGGKADLVLEEGVDPLEAGIDIVATPPGKPSFNNSLLSGGEKALTAVSLLLAIFQHRPSPFCVLDEVDAPFDEVNIDRFLEVLRDFLGWTKFIIVTHSKKTMTAATTLYGVTMQESGVSRRVSVRFDDVSENGEIAEAALQREAG